MIEVKTDDNVVFYYRNGQYYVKWLDEPKRRHRNIETMYVVPIHKPFVEQLKLLVNRQKKLKKLLS